MRIVALVLGIATALTSTIAAAQPVSVAEVGSFHVGGRAVSLTGLPPPRSAMPKPCAPTAASPTGGSFPSSASMATAT